MKKVLYLMLLFVITIMVVGCNRNGEMKICQSCAMPLSDDILGTEKDGSKCADYCKYCYENGAFTYECTMEQMIDFCLSLPNETGMTDEQYKKYLTKTYPSLKRWKK